MRNLFDSVPDIVLVFINWKRNLLCFWKSKLGPAVIHAASCYVDVVDVRTQLLT